MQFTQIRSGRSCVAPAAAFNHPKATPLRWELRASADLLPQSCSMKNGKYIQYSRVFHTFARAKTLAESPCPIMRCCLSFSGQKRNKKNPPVEQKWFPGRNQASGLAGGFDFLFSVAAVGRFLYLGAVFGVGLLNIGFG